MGRYFILLKQEMHMLIMGLEVKVVFGKQVPYDILIFNKILSDWLQDAYRIRTEHGSETWRLSKRNKQ